MKKFSDITEAKEKKIVFTFGRFNPPTTGHEKLILKLADVAKKNGSDYFVFPSHSENPKKDPLPHAKKIAYMRAMFPKHKKNIIASNDRNVFQIASGLYDKGYTSIVMVVGSDRVQEFEALLNKYNDVEGRHGYYNFDNISIVSAGERDPDAEGVTGMSASKMRAAAAANDLEQFKLGLPSGFKDAEKLFADVRKYMRIRESFLPHNEVITEEDLFRDLYLKGEVLQIGEEVTDSYTGVTGKVIRRGTNYLTFMEEDGTTHKKWLYELELQDELEEQTMGQLIKHIAAKSTHKNIYAKALDVLKSVIDRKKKETGGKLKHDIVYYAAEIGKQFRGVDARELAHAYETKYESVTEGKQDKDIKDREGTQPAKYYAKDAEGDEMAKSTKQARARHFEKGAEKDDDDDSAYKPAPGDKSAETKPSKYTNKMKKKFPDLYKEMKIDEDADASIKKKAEASGISFGILKQVYNRGVAAWRTGHRPGTTPEQWGHARVNSFITGGKTRTTADADLWKKHKGKSEEQDPREIGTDARREATQSMTPGQPIKSFTEFREETNNIYRVGSEKYFEFFNNLREGVVVGTKLDNILIEETDIGEFAQYEGQHVPLDCPMIEEEKDVELNKPKVGGPKKYYVYVKDPSTGNIKKVTWGDTTGLKVKLNDPEARKSFAARHKCDMQKDKTKASYWACNLPRYAKQLGLSGGGNYFW